MKATTLFLLLLSTLASLSPSVPKSVTEAQVSFVFLSKDVDGSISGFESSSDIDLQNLEHSKFSGSVAVETLKTGIFLRDWHLKGGKYFDKKKHPRIHFVSEQVYAEGEDITVKGLLTIKGITKPLDFQFQAKGNRLIGTANLYTSDFGIHIKKKREENKVAIKIVLSLAG
ncbi:YceI family protein [Spongiimicrobium sp. 2-473A-2-J]|uniref:YceI family protein n=1 Tax=Eudoraea algarum TaxID=3417568 RepID=UPI003D36D56D